MAAAIKVTWENLSTHAIGQSIHIHVKDKTETLAEDLDLAVDVREFTAENAVPGTTYVIKVASIGPDNMVYDSEPVEIYVPTGLETVAPTNVAATVILTDDE